ncbi:transposase [Mesorhizobium sp. WSM3626]|uniref:transposase n=1 Tax=Mesorhizobium sp. WSM3626 TaxID=1040987 RepID=UPI0012EB8E8A
MRRCFRFRRSSIAGAHLGLASKRYESGVVTRKVRVSKPGDELTRTLQYEASNVILTRQIGFSSLNGFKGAGSKKAKVAVARNFAVILHGMCKTKEPFRYADAAA